MSPISIILKVIANLGNLSGDLADFEADAKKLFAGQMTIADAEQLISDLGGILSMGFISIPGIDLSQVQNTLKTAQGLASDLISGVKDVAAQGVAHVVPDLGKAIDDLESGVTTGIIGLTNVTKEQVLQILTELKAGL